MRQVLNRWLTESILDEASPGTEMPAATIDRDALDKIRQLDPDNGGSFLREIVVAFCASTAKLMVQLRSAVTDGDRKAIRHVAHSLKGARMQIGATLLASLCERLVADARENDLRNARVLFEQAAIEHFAVLDALDKEVQSVAA